MKRVRLSATRLRYHIRIRFLRDWRAMARPDAHRVPISGIMQCCIDLKPGRDESEVFINQPLDVTAVSEWLAARKAEGEHYTFFHAFLTAIAKTIYNRPKLNYFVANRHLYEHNKVEIAFVAKMTLNDQSEEVMLVIPIEPEDNIASIRGKILAGLDNARGEEMDKEGANSAIDVLGKLPNPLRVPIFGIIKWLDKKGHLPAGLRKDNLYYSSMIVSNLGSIRCGAIYHNIANFGSSSSLATIGELRTVETDGAVRKECDFGITIDERIADGYYFAKSIKVMQAVLDNPDSLLEGAATPVEVPELR